MWKNNSPTWLSFATTRTWVASKFCLTRRSSRTTKIASTRLWSAMLLPNVGQSASERTLTNTKQSVRTCLCRAFTVACRWSGCTSWRTSQRAVKAPTHVANAAWRLWRRKRKKTRTTVSTLWQGTCRTCSKAKIMWFRFSKKRSEGKTNLLSS